MPTLPLPLPLPLIPTLTPHQVSSACSTSGGGYLAGDEFSTADACLLPFLWRIEQVGVGIGVGIKYVCPDEICRTPRAYSPSYGASSRDP